ncbi:helix-turn-helix transcriptional regulator [bacterium]|jgi:AraC-like DNA-binding protein|nr:helix-turn-helix transcriptional regulator [Flavobacteriaceae bacterium]MDA9330175.1 helix-turn-helix transcriptional regulator [bacterium]MDC1279476.1 helix-turn-helix transcriptional regulator [Flavobacteriaceae bacterium]MDC1336995.1 helix-turn-helix transcriptional regulator [Flavobacteriaceae bacterium]MDC1456373.1 helix-turn-helix transcriptional regulator [Flavobacteriaceae bacterium]|tara:strand:+ start:2736 stop:3617 length:882 start_codon:yes stop_codon:yes gene_type:complete
MNSKNIAKGSTESFKVDEGIILLKQTNENEFESNFNFKIGKDYIQFHFCLKGSSKFLFNQGSYIFNVENENSILLYNPNKELPIDLLLDANSQVISILISIKKFHSLFSNESDQISFLNNDNIENKLYKEKKIGPMIAVILNQMYQQSLNLSMYKLYLRGKVFELMSLYFNKDKEMDIEQCPFLADDNNIKKIKKAKEIIISRMIEPPTLVELAKEVDISLKKLKQGFKQVYGASVFSFLIDYKMQVSKRLLSSGNYNVNEVALRVGYSTATHFINAFKKKFGTTPKKYLMSI